MRRIHRSELKNAPWNPRTISLSSAKKLRENLKKVGLTGPISWNETTGNILGGHQRIAAMDALEKSADYHLDVAVVALDLKTEKSQNLFLNNQAAQGEWNLDLLADMFKGDDALNVDDAGFDMSDLQIILEDPGLAPEFLPENDPAKKQADEIVDIKTRNAAMRKKKKDWQQKKDAERTTDNHVVIVFNNGDEVTAFLEAVGGAVDSKFVDGHNMARLLDIELPRVIRRVDHAGMMAKCVAEEK